MCVTQVLSMFKLAMVIYCNYTMPQNRVISLVIERSLIIYQLFTWKKSKVVSWKAGILSSFRPCLTQGIGVPISFFHLSCYCQDSPPSYLSFCFMIYAPNTFWYDMWQNMMTWYNLYLIKMFDSIRSLF